MKLFYPKSQSLVTFSSKIIFISTSVLAVISLILYIFSGLYYSFEQKKQETSNYVNLLSLTKGISSPVNKDIWSSQKKLLLENHDTIISIDSYTSKETVQHQTKPKNATFGFLIDKSYTIEKEITVNSSHLENNSESHKVYVVVQIDLSNFREQWLLKNIPFFIALIGFFAIISFLIFRAFSKPMSQISELNYMAQSFIDDGVLSNFHVSNHESTVLTEYKTIQQAFAALAQNLEVSRQETDELNVKLQTNLERQEQGFYRQFQRMITRELNKTVSSVSTGVKILRQQYLGEEQQDALSIVRNGSMRLSSILEQGLLFDKIEHSHVELDLIEFNSLQLFSDVIDDYKIITERESLELEYEVSHQNHVLEGDVDNIKTILGILLDNAVKYTQTGSINLKSHMQHFDSSTRWEIRVIDTGIGIDEEYWDDVFTPFFQVDNEVNQRQEGIGLGLTLAKKLTELMGGNLSIRSESEKGCDFELILPMMDKKQIMARNQLLGLNIVIHQSPEGDEVNLSSMGGETKVIHNVEETVSYSVNNRVDVLVINADISEIHAVEISKKIRFEETVHRSLICWLSQSDKHIVSESSMQSAGIDMVLTKPYTPQTIANTIQQWL